MSDDVVKDAEFLAEVHDVGRQHPDIRQSQSVDVGHALANLHRREIDADKLRLGQRCGDRYEVAP